MSLFTCQGKTKDGRPCSRIVKGGALYCWQHRREESPWRETYELLTRATPEEKTEIILQLIEKHPEGRLELPTRGGVQANLSNLDLSVDTIKEKLKQSRGSLPVWWNRFKGLNLCGANLQGANLKGASLRDADMAHANLEACDLTSADLQGAHLGGANLQKSNLEGTKFQKADLSNADLRDANLLGTDFRYAHLWNVDLRDVFLDGTDFQGATLFEANLRGAYLIDVYLSETRLAGSKLERVDLSRCGLTHIYIGDAWLEKTNLRYWQLDGAIGEERAKEYREAKRGYRVLKQNFESLGDYDAASWAYRKERRMEKLEARQTFKLGKYWSDQLVEWICDYGESVPRVFRSLFVVYVLFTLIYGLTWSVMQVNYASDAIILEPTRNLIDLAIFSLGAMTTMDPVGLESRTPWVQFLAGLEALIGIALTGLLGFVVGNRIRRP